MPDAWYALSKHLLLASNGCSQIATYFRRTCACFSNWSNKAVLPVQRVSVLNCLAGVSSLLTLWYNVAVYNTASTVLLKNLPYSLKKKSHTAFCKFRILCWEHSYLSPGAHSCMPWLCHAALLKQAGQTPSMLRVPSQEDLLTVPMISVSRENLCKSGNCTVVWTLSWAVAFILRWEYLWTTYFKKRKPRPLLLISTHLRITISYINYNLFKFIDLCPWSCVPRPLQASCHGY